MPKSRSQSAYRTLAIQLRAEIRQHKFADGAMLPTEEALAKEHGLGRQTVRRSLQELVAEGFIYRVPGRGTFVSQDNKKRALRFTSFDDLSGFSPNSEAEVSRPLEPVVNVDAASRLRLESDTIHHISYLHREDGSPYCYDAIHVPPRLGEILEPIACLREPGYTGTFRIIELLEDNSDIRVADVDQSISIGTAPPDVASVLSRPFGEKMIRIDRVYYAADNTPVELAIAYFLSDRYSYRTRFRRS